MSHETDRAKLAEKNKPVQAARRHKIIAIAESIVIGVAVVLAVGFYLGDHYANNKNADMQHAVSAAITAKK